MEPSSPQAGNPDFEDETELVLEHLEDRRNGHDIELRTWLNMLSLAVAAVLVFIGVGVVLQRLRPVSTSTVTTSTVPFATTTVSLFASSVGQDWRRVGPPWAQQVVFAPSEPQIAYLCGTPTNNDPSRQAPVMLGVSLDSGRIWQALATPILASGCQLGVDPTNAQDLILDAEHCLSCSTLPPEQLYRSLDGGHSWYLDALPPSSYPSATYVAFQWAWQGSTLFVMPFFAGTQGRRLLAISVAERPLAWVNQKALLTGVPAEMELNDIYANKSAVYADFDYRDPGNCSQNCLLTKVSFDDGVTWSAFRPQFQGNVVQVLDQSVSIADGHTLIGQALPTKDADLRIYVTSADGGATWTPIPSPPAFLVIGTLASTPSDICYAEMWGLDDVTRAQPAVYRLVPGASAWKLVGALPNSGAQLVLSWGVRGSPLALWSELENPSAQIITGGLTTHAP